jgi:hypothetical protein
MMYRNFEYDSSNSGTFYFDLQVDVNSQPAPADAYYGMSGVRFSFLDSGGNTLGSVWYVSATTNHPFTLGTATRSVNQISENVMEHYAIDVLDMLSQITIDESQIADIQMQLITYSSTYPYPFVSAELWIDNVSTEPFQEIDCFDGMDNDSNGLTDCEDPVCDAVVGPETMCGVGVCAAHGNLVCEGGEQIDTCQLDPTGTGCPAGVTGICASLRRDPKLSFLDQNLFKFEGTEGEVVTITLEEAPGDNTGELATLIIEDHNNRAWLFRIDRSALPNTITTTLPATGQYRIFVAEQPLFPSFVSGERFRGNYCLSLESSQDAWQTLEPAAWLE